MGTLSALAARLRQMSRSCSNGWLRTAALIRIHSGHDGSRWGVCGMCRCGARTARECQKQLPSPAAQPHVNFLDCQSASFQGGLTMRTAARSWRGS
eukprot:2036313-Amphidinium_carterae.1